MGGRQKLQTSYDHDDNAKYFKTHFFSTHLIIGQLCIYSCEPDINRKINENTRVFTYLPCSPYVLTFCLKVLLP